MHGYWKATVDGLEVGRGRTPEEAMNNAMTAGHDQSQVVLEFVYEIARI